MNQILSFFPLNAEELDALTAEERRLMQEAESAKAECSRLRDEKQALEQTIHDLQAENTLLTERLTAENQQTAEKSSRSKQKKQPAPAQAKSTKTPRPVKHKGMQINDSPILVAGYEQVVAVRTDGTVLLTGAKTTAEVLRAVSEEHDVTAAATGEKHTVFLHADGTVSAIGDNERGQCDVSAWRNIVAVAAADDYSVGLCADGTVRIKGLCREAQEARKWKEIKAVAAGEEYYGTLLGLRNDGTVVSTNKGLYNEGVVSGWKEIIAISAGGCHTAGLHADGTYVLGGKLPLGASGVRKWSDLTAVAVSSYLIAGLHRDGHVSAYGTESFSRKEGKLASEWKDIASVSVNGSSIVGLKRNGSVVQAGYYDAEIQKALSSWQLT